jgi:DNA replication protein DnaT
MRRSWIKIETNTPDKPEICTIASQLRLDTDSVMGKLVRLWAWAELNVSKGNETTVTLEFLDKLVGKKGFAAALEAAGWLRRDNDRLSFPNFERHNGRAAKGRAQTALRVSRHRARKAAPDSESETPQDAITPQEVVSNVTPVAVIQDAPSEASQPPASQPVRSKKTKSKEPEASTNVTAEELLKEPQPSPTPAQAEPERKTQFEEQPLLF